MKCIPEWLRKRFLMKNMRRMPDFYEIKCAAGKIYQTKCAAGQIFWPSPPFGRPIVRLFYPLVWVGPKLVRPHRWRSWVMVRSLEIQGPDCRETLHRPLPKATLVCLSLRRRRTCTREVEDPLTFTFPVRKWYWTGQLACWPRIREEPQGSSWPVFDLFRLVWEC